MNSEVLVAKDPTKVLNKRQLERIHRQHGIKNKSMILREAKSIQEKEQDELITELKTNRNLNAQRQSLYKKQN